MARMGRKARGAKGPGRGKPKRPAKSARRAKLKGPRAARKKLPNASKSRPRPRPLKKAAAKPPRAPKASAPNRAAARKRAAPRKPKSTKPKRKPAVGSKRRAATQGRTRTPPAKRPAPKRRLAGKPKRRPVATPRARVPRSAKPAPDLAPRARLTRRAARHHARVSVFVGASVDGFIARDNGDLDFLEAPGDPKGEDYGYKAFVGEIDAIVMGRKTFEKVLSFKGWPYAKTPVVVLTTRPLPVPPRLRGKVETMADRPGEVVKRLGKRGLHRLYVDGGRTVQGFMRSGVVDEITITRVPILLGQGVPLFGALPADVRLKHLDTRAFKSGMVQTTYSVKRRGVKEAQVSRQKVEAEIRKRFGEPAAAPPAEGAPAQGATPEPPPAVETPSVLVGQAEPPAVEAPGKPEGERSGDVHFPSPDPAPEHRREDE